MSNVQQNASDEAQRERMARFRALAETTKNPLYNWLGIAYALGFGEAIPNWCLAYLSECSASIFMLMSQVTAPEFPISIHAADGSRMPVELEPQQAAAKIAEALKIVVAARSYNAFKHLRDDEQKIQDAALYGFAETQRYWRLKRVSDSPSTEANEHVPESFYDRCFGTLEQAETAPDRALETIRKRRNLDNARSAKARIKAGRKLRNPNEMPLPGG